jgi:hypothetical protein
VQQTLPEQLQIFLEQVLLQDNQSRFLLELVEHLVRQPGQLQQMRLPHGHVVLAPQTSAAAAVQLHLEVWSHLVAAAVVEIIVLMVEPEVLAAVVPLAELLDQLAQTLHLDGQALKILEHPKLVEVVAVQVGQVFLEAEVVQVSQLLVAPLLVVVAVGENSAPITVRPMRCLVETVD